MERFDLSAESKWIERPDRVKTRVGRFSARANQTFHGPSIATVSP